MNNNENHQSNQEPIEKFAIFFNAYKWRIIGFFLFLVLAILFITIGFGKTILIAFLCLIGIGIGYIKDCKQEFLNFINRLS
ncbi:DUF2273 domain-containing protein (plasmid) [Staphylococcus chromogenes]|uniref:DUF2273 domain-containing protein n=1 Tax=Staphylococcus TaxID=1279 RepID=UPI00071F9B77|nr:MULTISPECIES: DUF2273 domain-containing protein [Staphylococcus]ALN76076.1 DUF2273 domain-containing protein [Staphylococcus agnetis]MDG4944676.1 DUF2273 domain-containing protein [Staphylococcus agnetis]QIN27800.1 DUF2273 domain-containing protein [Staphylococcus chromogenes]